jgi:phenylacetate-CoA ligase
MSTMIERIVTVFKERSFLSQALRYNPLYYRRVRNMLYEVDDLDREERRELSDRLTTRTLKHAARLPGNPRAGVPLHRCPIIEKQQVRDDPTRYQAPGMMRVPAATSGATGIPVQLKRSLRNIAVEQAFIDHVMDPWEFNFKDSRRALMRADAIKPQGDREPPYGIYRAHGTQLLLSANHVCAATVKWYYDELRQFNPDFLFAHPSSCEALATVLQKRGLSLHIPVVLTSSEMLHPGGRKLLERAYNATVLDYYGMSERLVFASSIGADGYYFNPAYGRVELLEVDGSEAPPGYRALEIIATGYWNDAMPLVRYRSDDRVIVPDHYSAQDLEDVCLGLLPVQSIQGRDKEYIVSPDGQVIVGLNTVTHGIKGLLRMQVVQEVNGDSVVRVVIDPRIGRIDEARLMHNIYQWAPPTMRFTFQVVDQIERLPSGKTPVVIRRSEQAGA